MESVRAAGLSGHPEFGRTGWRRNETANRIRLRAATRRLTRTKRVMQSRPDHVRLNSAIEQLVQVRNDCLLSEQSFAKEIDLVDAAYRVSARNLAHYLGLRRHDLRALQQDLSALGLSSLGRTEAYTLAGINAVLSVLYSLTGRETKSPDDQAAPVDFHTGPELLRRHTEELLGPFPPGRNVYTMITMAREAAHQYAPIRDLVAAGMDVMRINCAHDDAEVWRRTVDNLRRAQREVGRTCRVSFELSGPRLRTGPIKGACQLVRWKPRRNHRGLTTKLARIWITRASQPDEPPAAADAVLPVDDALVSKANVGDELQLRDSRGRRRKLRVIGTRKGSIWAESDRTAYVETGTRVRLLRGSKKLAKGRVGELPSIEPSLVLFQGDRLIVTDKAKFGRPAITTEDGVLIKPAQIACTPADACRFVSVGDRVFFDDGKIGGVVRSRTQQGLEVEIKRARLSGSRLRGDRGINLPDSDLSHMWLTDADLRDLDVAVNHADSVGLSFVKSPEDVLRLQDLLKQRTASDLGVILKIETRAAFEQLPRLLFAGLRSPPLGVMVARGDLAVELGFERLAEAQEEIIWLCKAAHVPVIWATQVLDNLAKRGLPSRAEVTDAAMSGRAECVMLNKGPYVLEAVAFLDNVLQRMQVHQAENRPLLPPPPEVPDDREG